jgi:choline dehydrogenase-like flavoprotein
MISQTHEGLDAQIYDVCVIGAGPLGISIALQLGRLGRSVLLLESGDTEPQEAPQRLADADLDGQFHVPMEIAVQRRLGGTSNLWGGRCLPLDPSDFDERPVLPGISWPVTPADVFQHLPMACRYAGCGEPRFEAPAAIPLEDHDFSFDRLERWSAKPRFRNAHRGELRDSRSVDLRLRAVATGFIFEADGRVRTLRVWHPDGKIRHARARAFVLACGGLENTRLLLSAREEAGERFGGEGGALGRYYMGHVYGTVAEIVLDHSGLDQALDYYDDHHGCFVRRRITLSAALQQQEALTNAAFWPDFPPIFDPAHGSGVLSFAYLALSLPALGRMVVAESIRRNFIGTGPIRRLGHLLNVVRDFPRTATFVPAFIYRRYLAPRTMPGFFQRNPARRYALRYHAEHLPHPDSRITLAETRDASGLRRARVRLLYTEADALPLLRTHAHLDAWLQRTGLGRLMWTVPEPNRVAHILAQCYDGHHQIGTTRMAHTPRSGVVDRDSRVFGSTNLFVAGSSVFPTSGQANPTLTAICLGLRLAHLLAKEIPSV